MFIRVPRLSLPAAFKPALPGCRALDREFRDRSGILIVFYELEARDKI